MATVALVHFPLPGHMRPALRLGRTLAEHGHRVVHLGPAAFGGDVERTGGRLVPLGEPLTQAGDTGGSLALSAWLARAAVEHTPATVDGLHAAGVDVVVHDLQAPWGRVAADWLGVPRVCSHPLFPPLPPRRPLATDEDPEAFLATIAACRDRIGRRWGVELGASGDLLGAHAGVNLLYTTPEIAGGDPGPRWRFLGPLLRADPAPSGASPPTLPRDSRPLVYCALGTVFTGNAKLFRALLTALADEPVRVLVATWGRHSAADLAPVPRNAIVTDRVDSRAVLRESAVHVTHGGAGSVHESIDAGVPMLCVPQGSDQFAWAARVEALGVGELAADESPAAIRAGVMRLLGDHGVGARIAGLGERTRAYDGAAAAARAVENAAAGTAV